MAKVRVDMAGYERYKVSMPEHYVKPSVVLNDEEALALFHQLMGIFLDGHGFECNCECGGFE